MAGGDRGRRGGGMDVRRLASLMQRGGAGRVLVIDSRTFSEYNAWHVKGAVNVCCSKLVKRRLQQDRVSITELLTPNKAKVELGRKQEVVVYDQSSKEAGLLSRDGFVQILLQKLEKTFHRVSLLTGGFSAFSSCFPGLCEGKPALPVSLSQPCLPVANVGPTRILPHLYLGSQRDVLNKDLMCQNGITYVLNASNTCPKPDFISDSHFMRIPVNDNYCEKLLPWLDRTNTFIDKAKLSNSRVIVHCLAGISRSATIAIAYIMKTMNLSSDDAYRFVKDRRPSISPNFNFLGQLLEFEKGLVREGGAGRAQEGPGLCPDPTVDPADTPEPPEPRLEPKACAASLQQGFNGLNLSAERILDTNRLKRSFSLDIKSVYGPAPAQDPPKLCKLDSPGSHGSNAQSPNPDYSPFPGPESLARSNRLRRKNKHGPGSSPTHAPPLPQPRPQPPQPRPLSLSVTCAPDDNTLSPSLPGSGAMWTKHRDSVQASTPVTPVTPTGDAPCWYFGADEGGGGAGEEEGAEEGAERVSTLRLGSSSAYVAFGCSEATRPAGQTQQEAGQTQREAELQRHSCQMDLEEGGVASESRRSREELGKAGKTGSFSGSMELIQVS